MQLNSLGMQLAYIPAGRFSMGSPKTEPGRESQEVRHEVELTKEFYLSVHEVTVGQFREFIRDAGHRTEAEKDGKGSWGIASNGKFERDAKYNWTSPGFEQADDHPVVDVSNFGDLDNDGYLDFYLGTGYPDYEALMPNVMYHNQGGTRFSDITFSGGFGHLQKGHGIAFADLDNDGDQDVYAQMGGAFPGDRFNDALFENPGSGNHWIAVRLVGTRSNRSAIGAQIQLTDC